MKILIFGGTVEARKLADILSEGGHEITLSLAGRTKNPKLPKIAKTHIGAFGDIKNLCDFIKKNNFQYLIDATHPYAKNMSEKIVKTAKITNISLVRLSRKIWTKPASAKWIEVNNFSQALEQLPNGAKVFITSGHKDLEQLNAHPNCKFLVRLIEEPKTKLAKNIEVMLDIPPYGFENEIILMKENNITHLITKNSGGEKIRAKIDASVTLNIPIIIINRPKLSPTKELFSIKEIIMFLEQK